MRLVRLDKSRLVDETRRRFPAWCVEAYRVDDTFVVEDERGRYWRAVQGTLTFNRKNDRNGSIGVGVADVLVPQFGPCEEIAEVLLTGL